jgi:4-aminobutyrate aminotransferase-like enzyme
VERARENGELALKHLRARLVGRPGVCDVRGKGLLLGVELDTTERTLAAWQQALRRGVIVLPSGDDSRVLSITPPLTIETDMLCEALDRLAECVA